jgi:hypothetical protein
MVPAQDEDAALIRLRLRLRRDGIRLRSSSFGETGSARARVRFLSRHVLTTMALLLIGGSSVLACPVCFGAEETSIIDGTKAGILVLLGVTLVVQGGFVGFFLYLRNRAKRLADAELDTEWAELQGASRTS